MLEAIILGNDHTNSLGVTQSLGSRNVRSYAYLWGTKTGIVPSSRYNCKTIYCDTPQQCIDKIILEHPQGGVLYACCDEAAYIIDINKGRLKDHFYFQGVNNVESIYVAQNKIYQTSLAKKSGFDVPMSFVIEQREHIPDNLNFPMLIKPLVSMEGRKSDILICQDYDSLLNSVDKALETSHKLLLQSYIDKDFDYTIVGLSKSNGEIFIPAIVKKNILYPLNVGLESDVTVYSFDRFTFDTTPIKNYITEIGYVGLFSIEYMHSKQDGKFYFIESNLRHDGITPAVSKAGVNLAHMYYLDMQGIEYEDVDFNNISYRVLWENHHLQSLKHHDITLSKWIDDIIKTDAFLFYSSKDVRPFF